MIDYELSSIEIDDLLCVASLNPEEYGEVVYWARGILDHRYEITTYENSICEDEVYFRSCLLYTSPSPRDQRGSRMPSSA